MKNWISKLPTFIPNSSRAGAYPEITLKAAERFPHALDELGKYSGEIPEPIPVTAFNREPKIAEKLKERFMHYGSDKSKGHKYHLIYGEILARLGADSALNILEVGLGTNNPALISNMGKNGQPGASLRAFRDVVTNGKVYGADIDVDILFTEPNILTAWVDQLEPSSFWDMNRYFGDPRYDLVIDDGLHSVSANLNTLLFGLEVLKPGGWVVIEDIWSPKVCWKTIYRLLPAENFNKFIIEFPNSCWVFVVQKKGDFNPERIRS